MTSEFNFNDQVHEALKILRKRLPQLVDTLHLPADQSLNNWLQVLYSQLIPQYDPEFPLLVAICGSGSSGKSTLFNSLINKHLAVVRGQAGISRRVLAAAKSEKFANRLFMNNMFQHFGTMPQPLANQKELLTPGPPVYTVTQDVPDNVVFIDTPDFDTGFNHDYTNRKIAKSVLVSADILIYIFTNTNYNNREDTRFISQMLTECGRKKCILLYRVSGNFTNQEVQDHANTLASHLYGPDYEKYILGTYYTRDNNQVATGKSMMALEPAQPEMDDIFTLLSSLDPRTIRQAERGEKLSALSQYAQSIANHAQISVDKLQLYTDLGRIAESNAIFEALSHFPTRAIADSFNRIWMNTSPKYIKTLRWFGKAMAWPGRRALWLTQKTMGAMKKGKPEEEKKNHPDATVQIAIDLLQAINNLRSKILSATLQEKTTASDQNGARLIALIDSIRDRTGDCSQEYPFYESVANQGCYTLFAETHPAMGPSKDKLETAPDIKVEVDKLANELYCNIPQKLESELGQIIAQFRQEMKPSQKSREMLFASLDALPTLMAVSYVLMTSDVVGGTTIATKIGGMFGLNDLCALIAIPASSGLNELDRKYLEKMLGPATKQWFNLRSEMVKQFLRQKITNQFLEESGRILAEITPLIHETEKAASLIIQAAEAYNAT